MDDRVRRFRNIVARISVYEDKISDGDLSEDMFCSILTSNEIQFYLETLSRIRYLTNMYRAHSLESKAEELEELYFGD